jgi:hypothetical protein
MPAVLTLALGACADVEIAPEGGLVHGQQAALSTEHSEAQEATFLVTRDMKKCAAPRCGGFYVSPVNTNKKLLCADGEKAHACYVAEIHFQNGLSAEHGDLVRGILEVRDYEEQDLTLKVLEASAAFAPVVKPEDAKGSYYTPYDTGRRCITSPCNSMGVLTLNKDDTHEFPYVTFGRENGKENAALQDVYYKHYSETLEAAHAGQGNVVFGKLQKRYDQRARRSVTELSVTNVFVPKTVAHRQCLVHEEGNTVVAWNASSEEQVYALSANLTGKVTLSEGSCSDIRTMCPLFYLPVHGVIDALGDSCEQASNACAFRAKVINAAGVDGKAGGTHSQGACEQACESDADCGDGFCGWNDEDGRVCRPWAAEGEHCEGFVVPSARRFCRPDLACQFSEATHDAGGICAAAAEQN